MSIKYLDVLKTIKEQSPYYNMTFAIILFFILFLPIFIGAETLNKIPELTQWRLKFLPYITILFILCTVFGCGQFISKKVNQAKNKKLREKTIKQKQKLLSALEDLYNMKEVKEGWESRENCVNWSNKVAPLLKFNSQYYANFLEYAHRINIPGLSSVTVNPALNIMKSQVEMAIEELKNELEHTQHQV